MDCIFFLGFNSANFGATEEMQWTVLTENTNNSWRSSPVSNSNGLEWDGDFTTLVLFIKCLLCVSNKQVHFKNDSSVRLSFL